MKSNGKSQSKTLFCYQNESCDNKVFFQSHPLFKTSLILQKPFNKQGSIKLRTLLLLVLSIAVTDTFGTDYYISKEGNDHRSGTSIKDAWQTIDKVNATSFSAGDRVRFKGKHTFPGVLKIDSGDCGDPNNPLTISSYGDGRSSIDGNQGDAIDILSCTGVAIENINVMGVGRKSGNKQGIGIHVRDSNYVTIKNVEASGFQKAGVQITSSSLKYPLQLNLLSAHLKWDFLS